MSDILDFEEYIKPKPTTNTNKEYYYGVYLTPDGRLVTGYRGPFRTYEEAERSLGRGCPHACRVYKLTPM